MGRTPRGPRPAVRLVTISFMHIALAALFAFAILTLWVDAYWPVAVFQVGVFAAVCCTLWRARRLPLCYPLAPLALAVLIGLAQWGLGRTAYVYDTQIAILRWASFLAVAAAGYNAFQDDGNRRWFRSFMIWFAFLVSIQATVQTFTSSPDTAFWWFPVETHTATPSALMGPFPSRNHYAAFIEAVLPIALYEAFRRERGALPYAGMAATMYASVIASTARMGTILVSAEVVAVIGLMWARGYTGGRLVAKSLGRIAILFVIFVAVVGWENVWNRFLTPDPELGRREMNVASLHMIEAHPWTGVGMGVWPIEYRKFAVYDPGTIANQAHNDWFQWAAEGGIPFGIAMAALFFWCLRPALRSIWGLGAISVFIHATVDYPFSRPAVGAWTFLVIAMLAAWEAALRRERSESDKAPAKLAVVR